MKIKKNLRSLLAALIVFVMCFSVGCGNKTNKKSSYSLEGLPLENYKIVTPENKTVYEKYAAEMLQKEIEKKYKIQLPIVSDKTFSNAEILVGNTGRKSSMLSFELSKGQYTVFAKGSKIVLNGFDFYIAAGIEDILYAIDKWGEPLQRIEQAINFTPAENAESLILFIGDGMGESQIELSKAENPKVLKGEKESLPLEKGEAFSPEDFTYKGYAVTVNAKGEITDSAASSTALSTGKKTVNGVLGMVPADLDGDGAANEFASVQNVREAAEIAKMKTAVLSTDRMTGATPNGFLVHHTYRYDSQTVLEQQKTLEGTILEPEMLWCNYDDDSFLKKVISAIDKCENENGFFIMAEEAMIDKYASREDYDNTIRSVKRLSEAVKYAAEYAVHKKNVAVIVTADHETGGLTLNENGVYMWTTQGEHTDRVVPVFALGPKTEFFDQKTVDNTAIAEFMFEAVNRQD